MCDLKRDDICWYFDKEAKPGQIQDIPNGTSMKFMNVTPREIVLVQLLQNSRTDLKGTLKRIPRAHITDKQPEI